MFWLMDAVKKRKKRLPLPYASLHAVERICNVALAGRFVGS
jgi:hypothetical protein